MASKYDNDASSSLDARRGRTLSRLVNCRYYPATIVSVNKIGTVNLEYDDGAYWDDAPASVFKFA